MALRKVLKGFKAALIIEQARIPKTMLGSFIHKFKIHSMENRIAELESELVKRKTKKV